MKLSILCLYPNMMDLYGDSGNITVLNYRAKKRNIDIEIDYYKIGDKKPNFSKYDLVFLGGGSDREQKIVANDLLKYKKDIEKSIEKGVFYLLIAGGFQLFGKYYKDSYGNKIECLEMFDYYTESSVNKKERCIGDIIIEVNLLDKKETLIGFENHGGQTYGIEEPFGKVLFGNGNIVNGDYDGMMLDNVIGTYLEGPLLSKNPNLADYILSYCLERKYDKKVTLKKLDDTFEEKAREELFNKLLKRSK